MKLLALLLLGWMPFAQTKVPEICADDPKKGACISYEDSSPLRADLPQDLSFSSFYKVIIRTSLSDRSLKGAELQEAQFWNNRAKNADFSDANMKGFRGRGSDFSNGKFTNTDLRGAKLFYANFANADLRKTLLSYSDLSFADLRRADLRGADLQGAWILGTLLEGALFNAETKLPFTQQKARQLGMVFDGKGLEKTH